MNLVNWWTNYSFHVFPLESVSYYVLGDVDRVFVTIENVSEYKIAYSAYDPTYTAIYI